MSIDKKAFEAAYDVASEGLTSRYTPRIVFESFVTHYEAAKVAEQPDEITKITGSNSGVTATTEPSRVNLGQSLNAQAKNGCGNGGSDLDMIGYLADFMSINRLKNDRVAARDILIHLQDIGFGRTTKREAVKDSTLYKALWSLRHAMQVDTTDMRGEAILLFDADDYSTFGHASVNWQRDSVRFLKTCLDQADRALSEIEGDLK